MRQTRAAIVGTGGFPLVLRLFLETFKVWQDEVDVLYVVVDNWYDESVKNYTYNLVKQFPKVKLIDIKLEHPGVGWPNSYNVALDAGEEQTLLILHDDTFIYKKGVVDKYFKLAEEGKVVTPMHGIYEPKDLVDKAILKKYGWTNPPFSFLLYFLFISRENLEKTSQDFNGVGWNIGDDIPLLDIKNSPTTIGGDTGFLLGLELFEKDVPIYPIPRSETAGLNYEEGDIIPILTQWMENKENIFEEGWVHLQNTGNTLPAWFKEDLDARKWQVKLEEVRLAWMYEMMRTDSFDEIPEFKKKADDIFNGVMIRCGGDLERVKTLANIFHSLLYG